MAIREHSGTGKGIHNVCSRRTTAWGRVAVRRSRVNRFQVFHSSAAGMLCAFLCFQLDRQVLVAEQPSPRRGSWCYAVCADGSRVEKNRADDLVAHLAV